MAKIFRSGSGEIADSVDLDPGKIDALSDATRRKILELLSEEPQYPAEVARELGISKQKSHYHFQKLQGAGLIEKQKEERLSGGVANFYAPTSDAYTLDLGTGGKKHFLPEETVRDFLHPLVEDAELNGSIVVGSPDQHGEDQVRARDGHLAGEIGLKIGNYALSRSMETCLDTEIVRDKAFDQNLILLGGVLTNTVTKKFNGDFPASFTGDTFPYHEIETPEERYTDPGIGMVAKTENPLNGEKSIFLVAGIRNRGTEAAVLAFKELEELVGNYSDGEFYTIVRGRDMDGDGEIDDYEVLE